MDHVSRVNELKTTKQVVKYHFYGLLLKVCYLLQSGKIILKKIYHQEYVRENWVNNDVIKFASEDIPSHLSELAQNLNLSHSQLEL